MLSHYHRISSTTFLFFLCALFALGVFFASLMCGSMPIPLAEVWWALWGQGDPVMIEIVQHLRASRALAGFGSGGLLAVAGVLLQVLLRNPLADPYILGVSGGAASFALGAMLLALPCISVELAACSGALFAMLLLQGLVRYKWTMAWTEPLHSTSRLLLAGVALSTVWGALLMLMLSMAPDRALHGMLFWLAGDLNGVERAWPAVSVLGIVVLLGGMYASELNVLMQGEALAKTLGVAVNRLQWWMYWLAAIATAVAVLTVGTLGFVGLIVPHFLRLGVGHDQRIVLPLAALVGGTVVMGADLLARTIVAPMQWPVGVVLALLGSPLFLYKLLRAR